ILHSGAQSLHSTEAPSACAHRNEKVYDDNEHVNGRAGGEEAQVLAGHDGTAGRHGTEARCNNFGLRGVCTRLPCCTVYDQVMSVHGVPMQAMSGATHGISNSPPWKGRDQQVKIGKNSPVCQSKIPNTEDGVARHKVAAVSEHGMGNCGLSTFVGHMN